MFGREEVKIMTPADSLRVLALLIASIIPLLALYQQARTRLQSCSKGYTKVGATFSDGNHDNRASSSQPPGRLQSLTIYPVKSCQGIALQRSKVIATGLEFDRIFTFAQLREQDGHVDGEAEQREIWHFMTQRQQPLLATLRVELWLRDVNDQLKANHQSHCPAGLVVVKYPWGPLGPSGILRWVITKVIHGWGAPLERQFTVPLEFPTKQTIASKGYKYANVRIWKETVLALNMEHQVPLELRRYLGMSRRLGLFRMDPARQREVFRCAPRRQEARYQPVVDFHDAVS